MAEINGGSLKYTAEMDISALKKAARDSKGELIGLSDTASDTGKVIDKAITEASKVIESQKAVIADLQKKYEELQNTIANSPKEGAVSNDQLQEIEAYKAEVSRLKEEISNYQKKITDIQTVVKSFTNDNIKLKEELATLKNELLNVAKANVEVQKSSEVFEVTAENIKIQKDVIADLEKQYKELQKTIEDIAPGQAKVALMQDAAELATEIELEKNALSDLENYVRENAGNHENLRQKLVQVKNEMIQLAAAGERGSARYQELSELANQYQSAIDEVNATMESLGGNNALNGIVETLSLAASGMAVYQGITALAGVENENLEKIMVRLQATMSIAIGIQQLQNSLQRNSAVIQAILAFQANMRARAEALATAATLRATIAQRAFNFVANQNPYVLLAMAIITVVGALALMSKGNQQAAEDQKKINEATAESAAGQIVAYKQLQNQYERLGDSLKAKEKFIEDNKNKFEDLGVVIENVADAEKFFVDGSDVFIQSLMLRAEAAANAQLAVEKYKEAIEASMNASQDESAEETLKYNINPNNSGVSKWIRGIFYKDDLATAIEGQKQADKLIKKEAELLQKSNDLRNQVAKTTATPPSKGTDPWYEAEISRLQNLRNKVVHGTKEYEEYSKQIQKYRDILNPPKAKKGKKEKELAEVFDQGSTSRLQQQISLLDRSMSRMGKDGLVALRMIDKYGKEYSSNQLISLEEAKKRRLELANELAEVEKRIQIKSVKDILDENTKLFNQYYSTVESLGVESANRIYGSLLKNGETQFEQLKKLQENLVLKELWGNLSDEDKSVLTEVNSAINQMTGKQSSLDSFKNTLQQTLSGMKTDAERLLYVQEQIKNLKNQDFDSGKAASLAETEREIQSTLQNQYQEFLNEQESFEQKKLAIETKYAEIRKKIQTSNVSESDKKRLTNNSFKEQGKDISSASVEAFKKTDLWVKAFGDLDRIGPKTLQKLKKGLQEFVSVNGVNLKADELKIIQDQITRLDDLITANNPYKAIGVAVDIYKQKRKELNDVEKKSGKDSDEYKAKLEETNKAFVEIVTVAGAAAKATVEVVGSIGDAFGGLSDDLKQTLAEVQQLIDGIVNTVAGYFSGNYGQMISGIVQIVGAMVKLLSGDKGRERDIKKWQTAVDELKTSYNELQYAIEKTAGEASLAMNRGLIENLEEQKRLLIQMRDEEAKKKKSDAGKIASFNDQISQVSQQINDVLENFKKSVTTTEFKDLATKLADALIEGFGKGEDAALSFEKVVDEVMKNAVINALKVKILEPAMKTFVDNLYSSMGYGNGNANANDSKIKEYENKLSEIDKQIKQKESQTYTPYLAQDVMKLKKQRQELLDLIGKLKSEMAATPAGGAYDGLTQEEIDKLKEGPQAAIKEFTALLAAVQETFPDLENATQSMKGDIKGVTEKTAGALESQINAIRIYNVKIGNENQIIFRNALQNLVQIEYNTRTLHNINKNIEEMNNKMKKSLAGIP